MKLKEYLQEEYHSRVKLSNVSYEVFKNPSKKELIEMDSSDGVRFIADISKEKLYVWDAYGPLHRNASKKILSKDLYKGAKSGTLVAGIAVKSGNEYVTNEGDGEGHTYNYITSLNEREMDDYLRKVKWIDGYISFTYWAKDIYKHRY